ncbi:MAG: ROK family protein [Hamadaea sp.]|nr:ROK family protein [Hamadaea sp.]
MPVTGSSAELARPATPGHLLALIRTRPVWTRRELLDATGMSRPTLLERLAPLFAAGLIHEAGSTPSDGGRPAQLIRFDDRRMAVLTFDMGHTHGRVCVSGVRGRELRSETVRLDLARISPDDVLTRLTAVAAGLADPAQRLIGVGVGLPGPISPATGLPGASTVLRLWEDFPVLDRLRSRWDVPIVLENDARAFALGEASADPGGILLGVKWSSGIGAGVVADGQCLAGADGAAGDIGHIRLDPAGPACRCGRRGCLAAYASGHALATRIGVSSVEEIAARAGEPAVRDLLAEAARRVGEVLAALIALVNPRTLVLGGALGELPAVVSLVDSRVRDIAMPHSTDGLRVVPSRLSGRAATAGLVDLVVRRVLDPDAVDRTLT